MNKKIVYLVVILVLLFTSITGCKNNNNDTDELKSITMATNTFVGLAPVYVAIDKGFFKEYGIDLSIVDFDDSSLSCSALTTDKTDIAYSTLDTALITQSQYDSDKLKVVSIVDESAGADGILATDGIANVSDLKGKTIGVSINQTSHYLLMQALESVGLTDEEVNLVNMTSSDAGVAFMSGRLDAAVTWEPYLTNAVATGAGNVLFSSSDAPGSIMDTLVVNSEDVNAEWILSVCKGMQKGLNYLNDSKTHEEAVDIISKYLNVESSETESMLVGIKLYSDTESAEAIEEGGLAYNQVKNISDFYSSKKVINNPVESATLFK